MRNTFFATSAVISPLFAAQPLAAQTAADTASVQAFYQEWFSSMAQAPERYASFYAEDGYLLPPGQPPAKGRAAIAEWLRRSRETATYRVEPEAVTVDEIRFPDSSWVVHRGSLRGLRISTGGGEPAPFETKYFDLLHRTDEGRWEVAWRMWSDNQGGSQAR